MFVWTDGNASIRDISNLTGMPTTGIAQLLERRGVRKQITRGEARALQSKWSRGEIDRM